jgi:hypothetical protein
VPLLVNALRALFVPATSSSDPKALLSMQYVRPKYKAIIACGDDGFERS